MNKDRSFVFLYSIEAAIILYVQQDGYKFYMTWKLFVTIQLQTD